LTSQDQDVRRHVPPGPDLLAAAALVDETCRALRKQALSDRALKESALGGISVCEGRTTGTRVDQRLDAVTTSGFIKSDASSFGFTTTESMMIFSGGTGVSLNPLTVDVKGRTLVSRRKGISSPLTFR